MGFGPERRAELIRKGAVPMTVREWLGADDVEMELIELRFRLSREVKRLRMLAKLSQQSLADRMKVSRPRIPEIESGVGVSLETVIGAYLATGGTMDGLAEVVRGKA